MSSSHMQHYCYDYAYATRVSRALQSSLLQYCSNFQYSVCLCAISIMLAHSCVCTNIVFNTCNQDKTVQGNENFLYECTCVHHVYTQGWWCMRHLLMIQPVLWVSCVTSTAQRLFYWESTVWMKTRYKFQYARHSRGFVLFHMAHSKPGNKAEMSLCCSIVMSVFHQYLLTYLQLSMYIHTHVCV